MGIRKKLFKILSLEFFAKIFLGIIGLSLIRYMSVEDFAIYVLIFTTVNLVTSLIGSAVNKIFILGNFEKLGYSLSNFLTFQIFIIVIIYTLLSFISNIFGSCFWAVCILIFLRVIMIFIQTHFQKIMNFRKYYQLEYFRAFLYFVLFLGLLYFKESIALLEILSIQIISFLISCILFGYRLIVFRDLFEIKKAFEIFIKTKNSNYQHLYLYSLGILLLVNIDVFMLKAIDTNYQVAIFGAAFTFYSFLQLGLGAVNKLFLPLINSMTSKEEIKLTFKKHNVNCLYLIPVLIFGLIISEWIIPFIDGGKYPESVLIFQVLAISAFISFVLSPYVNIILKVEEFSFLSKNVSFAMFALIIINIIVIPNYHAIGLAFVNLFVYGIFNYVVYAKANKLLKNSSKLT